MSIKRLVPLNLPVLSTLPAGNRRQGDLVYYSVDDKVYVFDGEEWVIASGSGTSEGTAEPSIHPFLLSSM